MDKLQEEPVKACPDPQILSTRQLLLNAEESITKALHYMFLVQIDYNQCEEDIKRDQNANTVITDLKRARSVVRARVKEGQQ